MESAGRRIIAVCTFREDAKNLNPSLNRLIEVAGPRSLLPLCVAFSRSGVGSRGAESSRELMAAFDVPCPAGFCLYDEKMPDRIESRRREESGGTEIWPIPFGFIRQESCGC